MLVHIAFTLYPFLNLIRFLFFSFLYFSFSFILVCFITLRQDFLEPSLFDLALLVPSSGVISMHHHTLLVLFIKSGLAHTLGSSTPPSGGPPSIVSLSSVESASNTSLHENHGAYQQPHATAKEKLISIVPNRGCYIATCYMC